MSGQFPFLNPKEHQEIFRVTDSINALGLGNKTLSRGEYASIMRAACNALSRSLQNGLEEAIVALAKENVDKKRGDEVREILMNADKFTSFLKFEEELLAKCGLSRVSIEKVVSDLRSFRQVVIAEGIPESLTSINSERLLSAIKNLRDRTCEAAADMEKNVGAMRSKYEDRVWGFQISGAGLIVGDLTVLAASAGTLAVFSTVSTGAGGLMLSWERFFLKDPTKE